MRAIIGAGVTLMLVTGGPAAAAWETAAAAGLPLGDR